jgi:serine/threonine-protein kinase SRK2
MKAKGNSDPLAECKGGCHPKYKKIKDLNAGAFGFVQLCEEKDTGEKVAIKFMERGHKITKVCVVQSLVYKTNLARKA